MREHDLRLDARVGVEDVHEPIERDRAGGAGRFDPGARPQRRGPPAARRELDRQVLQRRARDDRRGRVGVDDAADAPVEAQGGDGTAARRVVAHVDHTALGHAGHRHRGARVVAQAARVGEGDVDVEGVRPAEADALGAQHDRDEREREERLPDDRRPAQPGPHRRQAPACCAWSATAGAARASRPQGGAGLPAPVRKRKPKRMKCPAPGV